MTCDLTGALFAATVDVTGQSVLPFAGRAPAAKRQPRERLASWRDQQNDHRYFGRSSPDSLIDCDRHRDRKDRAALCRHSAG